MNKIPVPTQSPTTRRSFMQKTSLAALAFATPSFQHFAREMRMGVVVYSYASRWNSKAGSQKYPGFVDALDLLTHCHQVGAGGVQVGVNNWSADFAKKVRDKREQLGLYLEGSIGSPKDSDDVARFENELVQAKEAGVSVVRTVLTSGRRYEVYHSAPEFQEARKKALNMLRLAEPVLKKHKMKLAVENHKDWKAAELVENIKTIDSEWIGVTLDFGNNIALLEDPMYVVETLAPYIFTTHVKDMAVDEFEDGILLSEVPLGEGILDLTRMVSVCKQHNPKVTFNLEMITRDPLQIPCLKEDYWSTFGDGSGRALAANLRMVRQRKFKPALPTVSQLSAEDKLAVEEKNVVSSFEYSTSRLGLK